MSINKIDLAIRMMENTGEEILITGGVSNDLIKQAEIKLGVVFSEDYSYFLEKYGCLSFESEEARKRGDISKTMINIKSSGYGSLFSLDFDNVSEERAGVLETGLSYRRVKEKNIIAGSFGDFFYNEISSAIDDL